MISLSFAEVEYIGIDKGAFAGVGMLSRAAHKGINMGLAALLRTIAVLKRTSTVTVNTIISGIQPLQERTVHSHGQSLQTVWT